MVQAEAQGLVKAIIDITLKENPKDAELRSAADAYLSSYRPIWQSVGKVISEDTDDTDFTDLDTFFSVYLQESVLSVQSVSPF